MCFLAFLDKCLFRSLAHSLIRLSFYLLSCMSSLSSLDTNLVSDTAGKYVSPFCGLSIHALDSVLWSTEVLILIEFDFSSFSLLLVLLVSLKKPFPSPKPQILSCVYLEEFLWFCPPLRSVTRLELNFVYGVRWESCLILLCLWTSTVLGEPWSVEKRPFFPHWIVWPHCWKPTDHKVERLCLVHLSD